MTGDAITSTHTVPVPVGQQPTSRSVNARPTGSVARLLLAQIVAEVRRNLRAPEYMIVVVALPVLLFAMFGLAETGNILPRGTDVGAVLFASLTAYGVISLAIFTFGVDVAQERGSGWLRRLRVTPMPLWVYLTGKVAMAIVYAAAIVLAVLAVAAFAGGIAFTVDRALRTALVVMSGAVAFSTMGFALAFWARPRAATAIGNLIFMPLAFTSGLFYSLNGIPTVLQDIAPFLPTYHFGQLAWNQIAPVADVVAFGSPEPESLLVHAAWVAGSFVVFGLVAVVGYRRDVRRSYR